MLKALVKWLVLSDFRVKHFYLRIFSTSINKTCTHMQIIIKVPYTPVLRPTGITFFWKAQPISYYTLKIN